MKEPTNPIVSTVERVDGQLHAVHTITDAQGNRSTTISGPLKVEFRLEDLGQLVAGACVMALPIATTGEVWDLGSQLSLGRTLLILTLSPLDWLRAGLVVQRTRAYESELEIQRGFLVGLDLKHFGIAGYIFNPDESEPTYVFSIAVEF